MGKTHFATPGRDELTQLFLTSSSGLQYAKDQRRLQDGKKRMKIEFILNSEVSSPPLQAVS